MVYYAYVESKIARLPAVGRRAQLEPNSALAVGLLILLGYAIFEIVMLADRGRMLGGLFLIFPAMAAIHLAYWYTNRPRKEQLQ